MDNNILPSSQDPRRDSWDSVNDQAERESTEDTEEWEQIIWPLRPMTCTSPPLSSATVQWDVPDPATEMSFFVTDADTDDEVSGGSGSPPQDQEESEEDWRIGLQLLNSVLQSTGSDSEVGFRLLSSLFLVASSPFLRHVSGRLWEGGGWWGGWGVQVQKWKTNVVKTRVEYSSGSRETY